MLAWLITAVPVRCSTCPSPPACIWHPYVIRSRYSSPWVNVISLNLVMSGHADVDASVRSSSAPAFLTDKVSTEHVAVGTELVARCSWPGRLANEAAVEAKRRTRSSAPSVDRSRSVPEGGDLPIDAVKYSLYRAAKLSAIQTHRSVAQATINATVPSPRPKGD